MPSRREFFFGLQVANEGPVGIVNVAKLSFGKPVDAFIEFCYFIVTVCNESPGVPGNKPFELELTLVPPLQVYIFRRDCF